MFARQVTLCYHSCLLSFLAQTLRQWKLRGLPFMAVVTKWSSVPYLAHMRGNKLSQACWVTMTGEVTWCRPSVETRLPLVSTCQDWEEGTHFSHLPLTSTAVLGTLSADLQTTADYTTKNRSVLHCAVVLYGSGIFRDQRQIAISFYPLCVCALVQWWCVLFSTFNTPGQNRGTAQERQVFWSPSLHAFILILCELDLSFYNLCT